MNTAQSVQQVSSRRQYSVSKTQVAYLGARGTNIYHKFIKYVNQLETMSHPASSYYVVAVLQISKIRKLNTNKLRSAVLI